MYYSRTQYHNTSYYTWLFLEHWTPYYAKLFFPKQGAQVVSEYSYITTEPLITRNDELLNSLEEKQLILKLRP